MEAPSRVGGRCILKAKPTRFVDGRTQSERGSGGKFTCKIWPEQLAGQETVLSDGRHSGLGEQSGEDLMMPTGPRV